MLGTGAMRHAQCWCCLSALLIKHVGAFQTLSAAQFFQKSLRQLVHAPRQQHVIVPHARIGETAKTLGLSRLTLCGSGDERLLAALQSRP